MFRYYPDVAALRKHHRSEHYLCSMCDKDPAMQVRVRLCSDCTLFTKRNVLILCQSSDICYAFRTTEEVREHLQDVHRVRDAHRYTVGSHFGKVSYDNGHDSSKNNHGSRHGRNGKPAPRDYFDLDVGSANPYNPTTDVPTDPNARSENNRRGGARRGKCLSLRLKTFTQRLIPLQVTQTCPGLLQLLSTAISLYSHLICV